MLEFLFEVVAQFFAELLTHLGLEAAFNAVKRFWGQNGVVVVWVLMCLALAAALALAT